MKRFNYLCAEKKKKKKKKEDEEVSGKWEVKIGKRGKERDIIGSTECCFSLVWSKGHGGHVGAGHGTHHLRSQWMTWLDLVGDLPGSMDAPSRSTTTEEIHFEKMSFHRFLSF